MSRLTAALATGGALVALLVVGVAAPASAHVLPTTTVVMDVASDRIDAALRIPVADLETASGIVLGDDPEAGLGAAGPGLTDYLVASIRPTTAGAAWTVTVDDLSIATDEELGTGQYAVLLATAHLVPPAGVSTRVFTFDYDAVISTVITHVVIVSVREDWASGQLGSAREIGTIRLDPVSGTVSPLPVDLGDGGAWQGFVGMVTLGMSHIREGTDHQLFLLTLLLPAPLLVGAARSRRLGRRWGAATTPRSAVRRIASITLAFTVGHSITLAIGALGLPIPQQAVEAFIAVSILVAAAHAIRPIFAGREVLVAGAFGLVHGMAFSATLTELRLTGGQLALSLLGFNLGVELMQLLVVALVLPPLCVLARGPGYTPLRIAAASLTAVAATGWLVSRLGVDNPVATLADGLAGVAPWIVVTLWAAAGASVVLRRRATAAIAPGTA